MEEETPYMAVITECSCTRKSTVARRFQTGRINLLSVSAELYLEIAFSEGLKPKMPETDPEDFNSGNL